MQHNYAAQYGDLQQWHWWFRGRQSVIESVLWRHLGPVASRRILSVGCGPAEGLAWLSPFAGPGGKVVGLDPEPLHTRHLPESVELIVGSLQGTPIAEKSFDLVLALDVLEHMDDDTAGLREAVRLVKPGGLLLVTVPALPSLWGGQDVVNEHRRRYTRHSLDRLFKDAGLKDYRINYFNTLLFPLVAAARWSRRALGLAERSRSDFDGNRPGVINEALAWVFALERYIVNHVPIPIGVSLVATHRPSSGGDLAPRSVPSAIAERN